MKTIGSLKAALMYALVAMTLFVWMPSAKGQTPDGTEANPFPIRTAAQLTSLAQRVNSGLAFYFNPADSLYETTGSNDYKIPYLAQGKVFKLVADITLNPGDVASSDGDATGLEPWIMLGTYAYPFDGVLDGDFHLISGVFVNSPSASSVGFCGATANHAIIRNLGVVNSYLAGTDNVGGLVGYMLSGTIEKCFFTGTVASEGNYTGGLVGQIQAGTTISTSYSSATITSSGAQVGGIVGKIDLTDPICVLNDLYSSSIIHGLYSYTGGIVGEDLFSPQSSYANAYYDAQLIDCPYTPYPQGIQSNTASMTTGSWMPSSGVFSAHGAGYYPYITGFDIDNDAVLFSIVPLSLPTGKTLSDLSAVSAIGLGGTSGGVTWTTAESVGLCAIDGGGGALEINGQCYVVLKATKGDNSRVYVLQCDKEPLLGTVTNPFPVDTLPDLTVIRKGVNNGARFTYKHFSIPAMAEGIHFVQTKDIDFSGVNSWAGIGNDAAKPFKGIYDGGNHAIIGWKYGTGASAFFWYTEGATIKNLTMRGVRSGNYAALVYCMMGGTVDNCHSVGSTSNMKGGLIYSTAVGDYTCIIKNCTNRNNITWTAVGTYDRVGGILSEMGSANNTIENCHNYGNITSDRYPGGVVGGYTNGSSPSATITGCSNSGNVSSTASDYADPSGIACMLTSAMTVSYCYNKGNITGRADRVAGIVATGGTISYCYNLGVISSPGYGRNTSLYGISYNTATYSFNAGKISNKATSDGNTTTCAYGISPNASVNVCFNAGDIYSSTGTAFSFISNATNKANHYTIGRVSGVGGATPGASYFDATRTSSYLTLSEGSSYTTTQLTGASASPFSSSANWVCEAGVYPRIKGLDTLTISKVLALPILFATGDNVDNVTQNFQVRSQWDIVWRVDNTSGATISAPSSNYQTVTVPSTKTNGNIILYAYKGDSCYYQITLKQGVTAPGELTVTSIGDLQALRTGVNSGAAFSYKGTAVPAGGKGTTFKVTADFALGEDQWTPIGTIESPFLGTFDGDGHTLSGLKRSSGIAEMGLFGYVKGKVKNVVMTDVNVTTTRNYGTVAAYLAGSEAEVSNCRVKGELTADAPHYGTRTYRGGIVGVMSYGATISGCLNEVNISAQRYSYNGGIVARVFDVGGITNCANAGNLSGGYLIGGICAVGGDSIKYCVNYGNVTGLTYTTNIAGIVSSGGKVASCVNSGKISVPMVSVNTYIAGIAATSAPKYCYNVGEIEAKNAAYAGGISASYGAVRCYNAGKVTGDNAKPVCGGTPNHCFYDKQMSVAEQAGSDTMAKSTLQMVSDSLKGGSKLGTTKYFVFSNNMYPRIKGMENTSASYATAAPVFLQNNETVLLVNTDFTMGGCDNDVVWSKGTNTALSLTGCNATINLPGLPTLEAKKNDTVYKKVSLSIGMDAFFIKDVTEMGHFRDGINSGAEFYYSPSTYKYYTTLVTDSTSWITVPALGVGATFRLINDLDFEGADWTPVGTSDKQFKGTFDGDNHTISNYALNVSGQYSGLFGRINSGAVRNLTITGVTGNVGGSNAGFLVGYVETAEILDVTIENSRLTSSTERVGALAGFLISSTCKRITVSNVYLKGTNYVGGFVGRSDNGFKLYNSTVSYSHIEGSGDYVGGVTGYTQHEPSPYYTNVKVIADTVKGRDCVGGWAGYTCWNTQSATKTVDVIGGTISGRDYVGGIIGYYIGSGFNNFTNSASVSGNSHVGGIAGRSTSSYSSNNMTNCHNHGDVTGTGNYVGGIYGGDQWELGFLTINTCTNSGNVSGVNYVGGISGRATYNSASYLIQKCVNTGDVTGTGNYVGGIVGESKGYTIGNTNAGRVTGVTYVGGIVGQQSNYPGYSRVASNSLSVGQVFGDEFVGNVAGSAEDGTVSNCYYDNQISPDYKGLGNTGADAANIAVGYKTSDMLYTGIQSGLGASYFTYEANLYPRTTAVKDSVVAIVAATPVVLADTVTAYTIPGKQNYTITPSTLNGVSWEQEGGRFTPVVSPAGFKVARSGKGVLTATLNGVSKNLYMMVGVSKELPCYIKNATQLTNFTNCINSGNVFWYDTETFEFLSSEPADLLSGITIQPGGSESFFKLDFDMSYEGGALWAGRIGTTAHPFLGDFNGGGHTITAMPKANTDTCGFFGVNKGSVYDLTMVNTNMDVDDATQKVVGAVCGLNSGSITNCHVKNGTVAGTQYVGGVVGVNAGYVENTHNSAVVSGQQYVGGIAGDNTNTLRYSFNLANLTASGTSTYLGGVAGNNTNTLAYCYNAGHVTATGGSTDYVGGVVGRNTGSDFASCYNVGNVTAVNAATAGGVAGSSDNTLISSLAYDRQMCVPVTVFGGTNGLATVAATQEMTGTGLQTVLGTDNWTYTDGLYPRLTVMADSVASIVSVTPVFLDPAEKVTGVAHNFSVGTGNGVSWTTTSTTVLDMSDPASVAFIRCGKPTITASKTDGVETKDVALTINYTASETTVDTICGGSSYTWTVNGQTYYASNEVIVSTVDDGCPVTHRLILTVPGKLDFTTVSAIPERCWHAENGRADIAVTGGFGQYQYDWKYEGTTISTAANPGAVLAPGHYTVRLSDLLPSDENCFKDTAFVIDAAEEIVASIDTFSTGCYGVDNDGMFQISVEGGAPGYIVSWGDDMANRWINTPQNNYPVTILADTNNTYTVTVTDVNNCVKTLPPFTLVSDRTVYNIRAYSESKEYDGDIVNAGTFWFQKGTADSILLVSGQKRVLDAAMHDTLQVWVSQGSVVNAGQYPNILTYEVKRDGTTDVSCKYNINASDGLVSIAKRNVTLTSADTMTFATSTLPLPFGKHVVMQSGDKFTATDSAAITYTFTNDINVLASSVKSNEFTINWNGVNSDNYNVNTVYGTLTLVENGVITVRATGVRKTYDGVPVTFGQTPGTHYTIAAYNLYQVGGTTENPIYDTIFYSSSTQNTITGASGRTYTVEVVMNDGNNFSIVNADTVANVVTSFAVYEGTGPGRTDITSSFTHGQNKISDTVFINPIEIKLTSYGSEWEYDAQPHSRPGVSIEGSFHSGDVSMSPYTDRTETNAGTYPNTIKYTTTSSFNAQNYKIDTVLGDLVITKRPLYLNGVTKLVDWNGSDQQDTVFSYGNLISGHVASGIHYLAHGITVGDHQGVFSGTLHVDASGVDVTANYDTVQRPSYLGIQSATGALKIKSAAASRVYNNIPLTAQTYEVKYKGVRVNPVGDNFHYKLSTGDTVVITPTNDGATGITDFGTTRNDFSWTVRPIENYGQYNNENLELDTGTLSIEKRPVTLTSGSLTRPYDGEYIEYDTVLVGGALFVEGQGADYSFSNPHTWVTAGKYTNAFIYSAKTGTDFDNYTITKVEDTLEITKKEVVVKAVNKSRKYGDANEFSYTMNGFIGSDDESVVTVLTPVTYACDADQFSNIGQYTIAPNVSGLRATNYSFVSSNGMLTITQRPITITANDVKVPYDGAWHTQVSNPATITDYGDLATGDEATATMSFSRYAGGTTDMSVINLHVTRESGARDVTNNYVATGSGQLIITKRPLKLAVVDTTKVYDGTVLKPSRIVAVAPTSLAPGDVIPSASVVFFGEQTTVGTSYSDLQTGYIEIINPIASLNVLENSYETPTVVLGQLEVTAAPLTITINDSKMYDESVLVTNYKSTALTATGLVPNDSLTAGVVTTPSANAGTYASTNTDNITTAFTTDKGISNYNVSYNFTQKINRSDDITLTCPDAAACTKMYDGEALQPVVTASVGDGTAVTIEYKTTGDWSGTLPSITNVTEGPQAVQVRATNANYDTLTCNYTLKIDPRPITLTAGTHQFEYTGSPQTWHVVSAGEYGFINPDTLVINFSPASVITTPSQSPVNNVIESVSWPLGVNGTNYDVNTTFGQGVLTMEYGPRVDLLITTRDTAWIFDGETHNFHSFTVKRGDEAAVTVPVSANGVYTFDNGDVLTVTFDENSGITDYNTAGVQNVITGYTLKHGDVDVSAAYNVLPIVRGVLRITPRPITIKANSHDFVYDGSVKSDDGYTVISTYTPALIGSDALTAVVQGSIQYPSQSPDTNKVISHSFTHGFASNYDVSYQKGLLSMHLEGTTTLAITAATKAWTYDGTAHSDATCTLVINGDDAHPITISNGQYTFGNGDVMTVSVTGSVTNVSEGEVDNVPAVVSIVHGTENVAGNYDYATRYTNGTLKVNPIASVTVNITGRTDEVTYNGSEHSVSGYDLACENSLFDMTSVTGPATEPAASGTNAGTYNMGISTAAFTNTNTNFTNVNFNLVSDGQLVINKKAATITANDESFTYDGEVHNASLSAITKDGFVNTADANSVEVSVGGSITYPSESPVAKTVTITTGNSNYDITPVNGQLTMTYGEQTALEITAASGTWTYDGNAHDTTAMIVKVGTGSAVDVPNSNTYNLTSNGDVLTVVYNGAITHAAQSPVPNRIQSYTITNNGTDVSGKYSVTLHDGALTVNQKAVTITAASHKISEGSAFTYDGTAHSDNTYTHTPLVGSDVLTANVTGSVTYPGNPGINTVSSYAITSLHPTDYRVTLVNDTLEVIWPDDAHRTALTITPSSKSKTYDGTPLTSDSYTLEYDGTTYTVGADGFHTFANGDKLYVDIQGSNSHVANNSTNLNRVNGTPTVMNGTVDVTSAYAITATATGTLTINPREVTITSANGAHDYDGNPFKKEEVTKVGFIGTEGSAVVCNNFREETNPGTYENTFDIASGLTSDYMAQKVYGMLTINAPEAVTVTITGNSGTFDYDGTEHTVHGYTWISTNPLYNASSFRYKTTAPVTDSVATAMVAGTHTMALSADDFENTSTTFTTVNFVVVPGTLTINKLTTPIVITAASDSKVYDGTELKKNSVTYTDGILLTGDELTATVVGSITNVGQYPNQISTYKVMHGTTDVTNCYTFGNLIDGVLTVTKRNATLTSATASKTYDGTALTNSTVTPDGFVTGQGATCTVTGTQTVVGSSANTFTYTLNSGTLADNYNITTTNGTLTVNQMTGVKVKITGHTDSHEYDGAEHSVSGYDVAYENNTDDLYTAADFTFNGTASAAGTHAGTHNMGLNASQFVNINDNFGVTFEIVSDGAMTITPVTGNVAVTVVGNNLTRVYDGNAYTVEGYTVTADNALYTEDCFTCSRTARATRTDAGTTNMGLVEGDFTNTSADFTGTVTFTVTDGYVTITQDPTAMTVTCPTVTTREYNGTMFKAAAATSNVAAATIKYSVDNTNWTDTIPGLLHVGTRTVYVKATHTNYADATCNYTLEVTPAPLTVTSATRNFIYCGSAHSIDTVTTPYTVSGLVAADAAATHTATVAGTITFPSEGSIASTVSDLVLTGASNDDYDITYVPGVLTVSYNPTTLTLTTYGHTWTYDGLAHDTLQYSVTIGSTTANELTSEYTLPNGHDVLRVYFNNNNVTNVSEGEVANSISSYSIYNGVRDVTGNYVVNTTIGKLKISPKAATVTANSNSWVYDGLAHTDNGYDVDGLVAPNTLVANVVGSQTAVGHSANTVTDYHLTNGDINNYTITPVAGVLTVTASAYNIVLAITSNDGTWTYDGTAHAANGYTLTIDGGTPISVIGSDYTLPNLDVLTVTLNTTVTDYTTGTPNAIADVKVMRGSDDVTDVYYDATSRTAGTLVINKRDVTVKVTGHTLTTTYDGESHVVRGYDLACEDALFNVGTVAYSGADSVKSIYVCDNPMSLAQTNFSSSDANFNASFTIESDGRLTINKRTATVTATDEANTYDGNVHNANATLFTLDNVVAADEDKISIEVSGSIQYPTQSPVTKHITAVNFTPASLADNYNITPVDGQLTMTYGERIALDIYSLSDTVTYDGASHHKDGMSVSVAGGTPVATPSNTYNIPGRNGDRITITLGTPVTDATTGTPNTINSYTILNGTENVADKYNVHLHPGILVVNKKEVTVTSATHEWPYDGYEHYDHGFTVEGLVGTDEVMVQVEGTVLTPDTITNEIRSISMVSGDAGNYTFVKDEGKLSVRALTDAERIALTLTPNSATKMYDGSDLTADGFTMLFNGNTYTVDANGEYTFENGDRLSVDIQGANKHVSTNATNRNSVNSWTVTHNGVNVSGNYNVTSNTGDLTITPRSITMTSADDSKVYDATALTNDGVTVTGDGFVTGEGATYNVTGTQTIAGSSNNTFTYELTAATHADDYTVATPVYGTLEVTKRPITITANDYTVMYDGEQHTYAENTGDILTVEAATTGRGLISGHVIADTTMTGARTDAGTTPIVIASAIIKDADDHVVTDNYDITFVAGTLTVEPRTGVVVTIKGHNAEYDYDGTYHLLQGYDVESNYTPYTESDFTFTGTALVNEIGTPDHVSVFPMGLQAGQFSNINPNYTGVVFNVTDGKLIIYPELKATVEVTPISCNAANGTNNDGKAKVTVTGGKPDLGRYTYQLNTNAAAFEDADSTFANLTAGDYTVTITDSLNGSVVVTFTLEEPSELTATLTVPTGSLCPNQGTYPVSVVADGGNGGFTFEWSGSSSFSSTTDEATNVNQAGTSDCGTTYTVTVTATDNMGCKKTVDGTFTVVDEEKPVFTAPADTTLCRVSGAISANPTTTGEVAQTDVTDNCTASGDFTISWFDTDTTGTDADVRVITRKWVVKDLCDNADTVSQTITVKPSILTAGNVTYTDPTPIEVTMKYGVCDTLIDVAFNWTNNMTGNVVVVDSTATPYMPTDHRFTAEHSPYTITWTLTDDCGDFIEVTQTITVNYPLCGGTFKTNADGDGIEYATVQVGCNCWMAENSRTTKYADGTDVTPAPMTYGMPVTTYGYLYNYYAATKATPPTRSTRAAVADGQGICPDGWHIPDDEDFADLMSHYEAEDLMSDQHWLTPGTNVAGFGLEPAGMYNAELDRYEYLYVQTFLWSYEPGAVVYHACQFGSACGTIEVIPASAYNGFSVRCVRNTED